MVIYKNIQLQDELVNVIRHMNAVEEYREVLQSLQSVWDNLTLLGQLSGASTDMSATRQAFNDLTGSLLNQLGGETLKKSTQEITAKAQVAVDILVRNLFERTADIGFLATDDDLRRFLGEVAEKSNNLHLAKELDLSRLALRQRFGEYVAKYSVYADIVLFDTQGKILVRLDDQVTLERSQDKLIEEALTTTAAYVETYRPHDFVPGPPTLSYAYRVCTPEGMAIGVLCLCFRFENEMERIFANLVSPEDWSVVMLLDTHGKVVASSDAFHIPVGTPLSLVLDAPYQIVRFAGREYLASSCSTQGYQGYLGPGWYGHAMLPIEHAFNKNVAQLLDNIPDRVMQKMMQSPTLFGEALRSIPTQAERIQADLNRSVWNGNVRLSNALQSINPTFSKILLWEISNTGARTKDVFSRSITDLHETVVSTILQDTRFLASLAIDIMDRNLYERANDCRWWALSSAFRRLLDKPSLSPEDGLEIAEILRYINGLYTVYSSLLVFDTRGTIIATSGGGDGSGYGAGIGEDWVRRTLGQSSSQGYAVSDFSPTPLYGGRHTYIYGAAIRSLTSQQVVGGIGIVFDSAPQFAAMLKDALPRGSKGEPIAGAFAVFTDRHRQIIACSDTRFNPGDKLDLDPQHFAIGNGESFSTIHLLDGRYFAVGGRVSTGYREYKGAADCYQNDVLALVFMPLCEAAEAPDRHNFSRLELHSDRSNDGSCVEIATFRIGTKWFGLNSSDVVEAVDPKGIAAVPGAGNVFAGYLMYQGRPMATYDISALANTSLAADEGQRQVILLRKGEGALFGILVDALGEIPEISSQRIQPLPAMLAGGNVLGEAIISTSTPDREHLLLVLGVDRIAARLGVGRNEGNGVLLLAGESKEG